MSRRRKFKLFAALALLGLLAVPTALAEVMVWSSWQHWSSPGSGIIMGPGNASRFVSVDMNGDGLVDTIEMSTHMHMVFMTADSDHNGFLSLGEYLAVRTATGQVLDQPQLTEIEQERVAHFRELDLSSDGFLSAGEFFAGAEALFQCADKGRTGRVAWRDYGVMDRQ